MTTAPAGWYRDPYRSNGQRYWDGRWTDHVAGTDGEPTADPLNDAPQLPAPVVNTQRPLSAEEVRRSRRQDLVARWTIFIVVLIIGGFMTTAWYLSSR